MPCIIYLGVLLGHHPQPASHSVVDQAVLVFLCEGPEEGDLVLLAPLTRSLDTKLHVLLGDVSAESPVRDEGRSHFT